MDNVIRWIHLDSNEKSKKLESYVHHETFCDNFPFYKIFDFNTNYHFQFRIHKLDFINFFVDFSVHWQNMIDHESHLSLNRVFRREPYSVRSGNVA